MAVVSCEHRKSRDERNDAFVQTVAAPASTVVASNDSHSRMIPIDKKTTRQPCMLVPCEQKLFTYHGRSFGCLLNQQTQVVGVLRVHQMHDFFPVQELTQRV